MSAGKRAREGGYVALCCNVFLNKNNIIKNRIYEYHEEERWFDILTDLLRESDDESLRKTDRVEVSLSKKMNSLDNFHPDLMEAVRVALDFDKSLKYVSLHVTREVFDDNMNTLDAANHNTTNAFDVLMKSRTEVTKFPKPKDKDLPRFSAKDKLYNDVIGKMSESEVHFPSFMTDDAIAKHVSQIVDILWYIDGSSDKLASRQSTHTTTNDFSFPKRFLESFCGYNDWKRKKQKQPRLEQHTLKLHSEALFRILNLPFVSNWGEFGDNLKNLSIALNNYANFLEKSNSEQKIRQDLHRPPRQVAEHAFLCNIPKTEDAVKKEYSILDLKLSLMNFYEYLFLDEDIHVSTPFLKSFEGFSFLRDLQLSMPINMLKYNPGGAVGSTCFIWKVPDKLTVNEVMHDTMKIIKELTPRLPEYHTRRMKKDFISRYSNLRSVSIPKHVLLSIYADLTTDFSADQNPTMDARVRQAVLSEDTDLVLDLRHLNKGRPADTFEVFFDILRAKVEELVAVDDRRHGVEHFSKYISVKDLIEDVKKDMQPDVPIPSESTVLFAFVPKNAYINTAVV